MNADTLRALEAAIADADRTELPRLLGELARLDALARLRLAAPVRAPEPEPDIKPAEKLIDIDAAAEMLGMTKKWIYDKHRRGELPFAYKLGPQTLRFSEPGILRWLKTRR